MSFEIGPLLESDLFLLISEHFEELTVEKLEAFLGKVICLTVKIGSKSWR